MGRKATKEIPLRPKTKRALSEQKPEGETWDRFLRRRLLEGGYE